MVIVLIMILMVIVAMICEIIPRDNPRFEAASFSTDANCSDLPWFGDYPNYTNCMLWLWTPLEMPGKANRCFNTSTSRQSQLTFIWQVQFTIILQFNWQGNVFGNRLRLYFSCGFWHLWHVLSNLWNILMSQWSSDCKDEYEVDEDEVFRREHVRQLLMILTRTVHLDTS